MKPTQPNSPTGWSRARVKYELEIRGWNWSSIAREHGYKCTSTPADVMRYNYPVMERIVAGIIGVHPMEIWPGRYDSSGNPLHGRGRLRAVKQL